MIWLPVASEPSLLGETRKPILPGAETLKLMAPDERDTGTSAGGAIRLSINLDFNYSSGVWRFSSFLRSFLRLVSRCHTHAHLYIVATGWVSGLGRCSRGDALAIVEDCQAMRERVFLSYFSCALPHRSENAAARVTSAGGCGSRTKTAFLVRVLQHA